MKVKAFIFNLKTPSTNSHIRWSVVDVFIDIDVISLYYIPFSKLWKYEYKNGLSLTSSSLILEVIYALFIVLVESIRGFEKN